MLQTAERIAVYHSVTVVLKTGSQLGFRLVNKSAPALIRKAGVAAQNEMLILSDRFPDRFFHTSYLPSENGNVPDSGLQ